MQGGGVVVVIERCTFHNKSADAIALNSPVLTSQLYSYWSTAAAITNVTTRNNVIEEDDVAVRCR